MTISERTLRKWRKEALIEIHTSSESIILQKNRWNEVNRRILKMTQELLDQHLMRRK